MIIITKVENNRVAKYIPVNDINNAEALLNDIKSKYPDAFIYDGYYLPELFVQDKNVSISAIEIPIEILAENVRIALQASIDDKAKSFGFSGGNALMLYAGFINPFQPLAQVFATWEASVWVEADAYKSDVIAGLKPMLSPSEAVALMPVYPS